MKTIEQYKDYYLKKLICDYGELTLRDRNSAKDFCYNEEWKLGEQQTKLMRKQLRAATPEEEKIIDEKMADKGNAIEGLDAALIEYEKRFDDGYELFLDSAKNRNKNSVNQIFSGNTIPDDPTKVPPVPPTRHIPNKPPKREDDTPPSPIRRKDEHGKSFRDYLDEELEKNRTNSSLEPEWTVYEPHFKNLKPRHEDDPENGWGAMEGQQKKIIEDNDYKVVVKYGHGGSCTLYGAETGEVISPFSTIKDMQDFKKKNNLTIVKNSRRNNMIKSSKETLYEDDGGRFYTWSELKADIDDFVKTSDFKDQFEGDEDMFEYFEKDHKTPNYYKIYMDFWDISSNGAMSEVEGTEEQWDEYNEQHGITSAKGNNMRAPIKSEYTGTNVSVEYGPYGEEKEFPFYDMKGETVEQIDERIGYYDEVKTVWGSDGESYMILQDRANSEDKIAVLEDDYNEWVESMNNEDYSKLLGNSRKAIKSANGSWEYQLDDMDEVEEKIGDIGISFTEPLLLADDGTLYTRAGFDQWLKYLEREEGDNWSDAYELYHRETDEEFIEMCQDDFFQHDFGHTLTIYPEGLKSIAESVAEEIPSNEAPFAIPSGFAFNLYAEEEEPSGFNSYWIDDMSLDSESFIWGINPKLGNRFDVAINPDYLWNGTENIQSSKKGEKKMKIQSKRLIKSGTSNFGSNDDVFGYSFPLVTYIAENYMYDEETDSETEERDYDADDWEYRDALDEAKDLADEMDIPQYDDYSEPYLCHEPFMIKFRDGYYEGVWIEVKEGTDEEDIYNTNEYGSYYDGGRPFTDEEMNKFADKLNEYFNKLCSDYGWQKLGVTARFSNGETMYHKIDNSRKPIQSANYDGIKKQMQYTLDVLKEDAEDSDEEYAERMGYDGTDAGAVRYAINRFKNEYGIRNRYNVVNQSELADWLAGLPLSFDYANYNILQKGVEWGYLPPIQEGTDLTRKETNWLDNWWNGLANNILKLARKYNVGITSSRKPVTSGLTFRQAVEDFKAAGQWNDYYEMQQDWESYKDGLERDGLISEKTRSTWGNPCTPETFKRWNK